VAREFEVELVVRIPFVAGFAVDGDAGGHFRAGPHRDSPAGRAFATLARHVAGWEPPGREGEGW
jgi:hypothetical protein